MREIKFRGYDGMEWVYSSAIDFDSETDTHYMLIDGEWVMAGSVGQYTGLKDKNGKEIYEGDIVELEGASNKTKHIIKFSEGTFYFSLIKDGMCDYKDFEVIGNIYENPEIAI